MGRACYNPMDAQRFDPLRRTNMRLFKTGTSNSVMRQGLRVRTEQMSAGNVRPVHNAVVNPVEGGRSDREESCSSPTATCATCATSPTPIDTYDPVDVVVTRTIIHPKLNPHHGRRVPSRTQMMLTRLFSRSPSRTGTYSPSPSSASPRSTPPSRFARVVLRAFNCFSTSSTFDSDEDDTEMRRRERPLLLVIVKETREKHEDDRAFKEIVGSVFPAAGVRGSA